MARMEGGDTSISYYAGKSARMARGPGGEGLMHCNKNRQGEGRGPSAEPLKRVIRAALSDCFVSFLRGLYCEDD